MLILYAFIFYRLQKYVFYLEWARIQIKKMSLKVHQVWL